MGRASEYDLAVVKLTRAPRDIKRIPLCTSKDLKIGQTVFAIGKRMESRHS